MQHESQRFSSRWALFLSVLGIAVGTGNVWRFPRIAAQNAGAEGAGAFLLAWVIFLLVWSIPLIIAEYALGRTGRRGTIGTFARVAGQKFAWMGGFVGFVATAIMFYYAVVAGWCVYYFVQSILFPLPVSTEAAFATWNGLQGSVWPVLLLALVFGLGALACARGVASIEMVSKILVPSLLVIVVIAVIRALTLEGSGAGLAYLFAFDASQLGNPRIWLEALTQNAWDTGAGWGLILTYGAYMKAEHGTVRNAVLTGVGNNTVSMLAAIMVFGTVFALLGQTMGQADVLQIMQDSGPASTGLTFIWMPQLFEQMAFGRVLAILFFLALSFAAFTSLMSMIELTTRNLVDFGLPRRRAIVFTAVGGFLLGLPSALNVEFLGNQDFVWGVALMISGAFVAFAAIRYGVTKFRTEHINAEPGDWKLGNWWDVVVKYLVPLEAIVLLIWWMYLAAAVYAPDSWYDPFNPYSVMTCLVQWGVLLALMVGFNRWMAERTTRPLLSETLGVPG